jgi:hypothetical protein
MAASTPERRSPSRTVGGGSEDIVDIAALRSSGAALRERRRSMRTEPQLLVFTIAADAPCRGKASANLFDSARGCR